MKYISIWAPRPDTRKQAVENFLAGKATPPAGVTTLGRWHKADGSGGFTLYETDSAEAMAEIAIFWQQFMDVQTVPVIEDAAAGAIMAKIYKS
ncbi:MAG: DUF3303 family protein [Acidobacteriaceae bacterium]